MTVQSATSDICECVNMPAYHYVCVCHSCRPLWNPHRMVRAIVCTSFAPPLQMVLSDSGSGSRDSICVTVSEKLILRKMYIRIIREIISTEVNSGKFQASIPRDTMIPWLSPRARARALHGICWPPRAFEDTKDVAARPWRRPYTNQLTRHVDSIEQV